MRISRVTRIRSRLSIPASSAPDAAECSTTNALLVSPSSLPLLPKLSSQNHSINFSLTPTGSVPSVQREMKRLLTQMLLHPLPLSFLLLLQLLLLLLPYPLPFQLQLLLLPPPPLPPLPLLLPLLCLSPLLPLSLECRSEIPTKLLPPLLPSSHPLSSIPASSSHISATSPSSLFSSLLNSNYPSWQLTLILSLSPSLPVSSNTPAFTHFPME